MLGYLHIAGALIPGENQGIFPESRMSQCFNILNSEQKYGVYIFSWKDFNFLQVYIRFIILNPA